MTRHVFFATFVLVAAVTGCAAADDGITPCVRDDQCPAGYACADGACFKKLIQPDISLGGDGDSSRHDLELDHYVFPDGPLNDGPSCRPNGDGQIARDELLFTVPRSAKTTVLRDLTLDLAQTSSGWDLSLLTSGEDGTLDLSPLPAWVDASEFPPDVHTSELASDYGVFSKVRLLGVFKVVDDAYQLVGLVSEQANHTKIKYDAPLSMMEFPLQVGQQFSTSAYASGYTDLFPVVSFKETYDIKVLARGPLKLHPKLTLDALLLRVEHVVSQPLVPLFAQRHVAYLFISECYATVARILVKTDPGEDLSHVQVDQMWRIAGL